MCRRERLRVAVGGVLDSGFSGVAAAGRGLVPCVWLSTGVTNNSAAATATARDADNAMFFFMSLLLSR
jgi:hypothetical protein